MGIHSVVVDHTNKTHIFKFKMKPFIAVAALAATAVAVPTGPIHPAHGDLVATVRGFRPVSLEGFSEDDNQDGFVDPVGQVAYALPAVAPYAFHAGAPLIHAAAPVVTKAVEVEAPKVEKLELPAAPIVTYAAAHPVAYHAPLVHTTVPVTYTHTVPVSKTYTQTIPLGVHRTVHTTHHVGAPPAALVAAAPAEAAAEEEA